MKKYLILFLVAGFFSLAACSDDDVDNGPDPILGTWVLVEVNPESPMIDPELCDDSTITFNDDGTASATFYIANNDCAPVASPGTWDHKEGSTYAISVPFVGSQEVNVNFGAAGTFSLDLQGTTLTFSRFQI